MEPVYFPFTYVNEQTMSRLADYFRRTVVYQPLAGKVPEDMRIWAEQGRLSIRTPDQSDDTVLDRLIAEYKQWADLHQASGLAAFKEGGDSVPFFHESSVSRIRKEIRDGKQQQVSTDKPDPFKNARIFLQIAQEFDLQQSDIRQKLASFEAMQQDLFRNLKGEDTDFGPMPGVNTDFDDHMIEERLMAWARLFVKDPAKSGLFLTGSREVVEHMIEKSDRIEKVWGPGRIPDADGMENRHRELAEFVERLSDTNFSALEHASTPENDAEHFGQTTLSFYIARDISPVDFFSQFFGGKTDQKQTGFKHILIGLMEL